MLIHMHRASCAAVRIPAGGIVPGSSCARCKPDIEGVENDAVRIIWIDDHSLIVPVLWVIAGAVLAVPECTALRALHEGPICTAVRGGPVAYLAAECDDAAAVAIA